MVEVHLRLYNGNKDEDEDKDNALVSQLYTYTSTLFLGKKINIYRFRLLHGDQIKISLIPL